MFSADQKAVLNATLSSADAVKLNDIAAPMKREM